MAMPGQLGSQASNDGDIMRMIRDQQRQITELAAQNPLTTAGIAVQPNGINVFGDLGASGNATFGGNLSVTGTEVVYDTSGNPMVRMGPLLSNPGKYGAEVWDTVNLVWVQLVTGTSVTWSAVSGKPSTFPPSGHTHPGGDITSAVANATTATNAGHASDADGSAYGFNNNVGGTSFVAAWIGNDGGNHFGKNVSSIRYKQNVRAHTINPANVLKLQPVIFDRSAGPTKNEYGLIAEQVHEHVPEIVNWFSGNIDSLRYDLLPVAQQSVLQDHDGRVAALESQVTALRTQVAALVKQVQAPVSPWTAPSPAYTTYAPPTWKPTIPSYAAPVPEPTPLAYTITP